jgi:hypothetical protein
MGQTKLANGLTEKQEKFCIEFVKHGDKSKAYRIAYNAENMTPETINTKACLLSQQDNVRERIEQLQQKASKIAEKKFEITHTEILRQLDILRRARIDEYFECVEKEVAQTVSKGTGNNKTVTTTTEKKLVLQFKPFDQLTDDQKMAIESIKQNRHGEIELRLHGKEWSIEKINKHIGFYDLDNMQKATATLLTPEEREERIKMLQNKLSK